MKKLLGLVTQINMYILLLALLFSLYNLILLKFELFSESYIGLFYIREVSAILISIVTIKLFFKVENRYKEEG
jgi:hypothetical protein